MFETFLGNVGNLAGLMTFGSGLIPSEQAVVFVDNQDIERSQGEFLSKKNSRVSG